MAGFKSPRPLRTSTLEENQENLLKWTGAVSTNRKMELTAPLTTGLIGLDAQMPNTGDIRIEYHPHSGKDTRFLSSEEFKTTMNSDPEPTEPPDDEPWRPFHSREEFEFAELVHDAALNRPQIERLMKLINCCQDTPGAFTFRNYGDLKDSLESASKLLTPVCIYFPPSQTDAHPLCVVSSVSTPRY